jgi:nucleoside phosphorylase/tetratricopeptide (TPR) repeat protein
VADDNTKSKDEDFAIDDIELLKDSVHFGIITALPEELAAMEAMLENPRQIFMPGSGAGRHYCLGKIPSSNGSAHLVVLTLSKVGNNMAANRATLLLQHFPNVKSIIMVGIAGGIPNPTKVDEHVRLGDIVISDEKGVVQYDFDKETVDSVEHRHSPRPPSAELLEAVLYLEKDTIAGKRPWIKYIDHGLEKLSSRRPPEEEDILVSSDDPNIQIEHPADAERIKNEPRIFSGTIAAANKLLKNPVKRDYLRETFSVKAVEMESSGIADATWGRGIGYLSVRGICDYCDSKKGNIWQKYAAVIAAAYTKALLESMPSDEPTTKCTSGSMGIFNEMKSTLTSIDEKVSTLNTEPIKVSDAISSIYKRDLKNAENLLNQNKPEEAFDFLNRFKDDVWSNAPDDVKYEILRFMASAKLKLLQNYESGSLLIEAFQYNPNDEKAIYNRALGHLLRDEPEDAKSCVDKVLEKNPAHNNAYAILIHLSSDTEDLEDIILKIPKAERNTLEVAFAMGTVARKRNNFSKAKEWYKIAYDCDDNDSPDIKANLAESMLSELFSEYPVPHISIIEDEKREILEKIAEMLTEVWNNISDEMKKSRISWIVNLSTTQRILGDLTGALSDIDTAIDIEPSPFYKKNKAMMLVEKHEYDEAEEILAKLYDEIPDAPLMHAVILQIQKEYGNAIKIINKFLSDEHPSELVKRANEQLMELYILNSDPDNAKIVHEQLYGHNTNDINGLISESRISEFYDDADQIVPLKKAKDQINDDTSVKDLINLAEEFINNDQLLDAAKILEMFVNKELNSDFTRSLLDCYYRSGEIGKALELCQKLRENYSKPLKYISEVEIAIYNEIDDLKKTKELIKKYLEFFPNNLEMRISQAFIDLRSENLKDVNSFLNSDLNLDEISLQQFIEIIRLCSYRDFDESKFLDLLYEMRRKFYDEYLVHAEYAWNFVFKEKTIQNPNKVEIGTAVCIETDEQKWFILEDRPDKDLKLDEINSNNPLFNQLKDKKVGNDIIINENSISPQKGKIIAIKNKYVHALHESRERVKFSPQYLGVDSISLGDDKETQFDPIFNVLKERNERTSQLEKIYKEKWIPLNLLSEGANSNILDTWRYVVSNHELGLRCYTNSDQENNAIKLLKNNHRLVIDLVSLFTIHELGVKENIINAFGKLGIAQSSIDVLNQILYQVSANRGREYITTAWINGKPVGRDVTPEDTEKSIKYLEKLIQWVKSNCEILPCYAALNFNREKRNKLNESLGKSFTDTLLVSSEPGNLLYSDDCAFRRLAKLEYDVDGVWTQGVLDECLEKGHLKEEDYNNAVVKLIHFGYNSTTYNASTLLAAAEKSKWLPLMDYTYVIDVITQENTDLSEIDKIEKKLSLIKILSGFMYKLSVQSISKEQHDSLISYLTSKIACRSDGHEIIYGISCFLISSIQNRIKTNLNY